MAIIRKVYVDGRTGGFKFGMDDRTPVRFVFSNVIPKFASRYYGLSNENIKSVAVQAWIAANPVVVLTQQELIAQMDKIREDERAQKALVDSLEQEGFPVLTGRLNTTEPNLQNLPIRTKEGDKIRKAFTDKLNNEEPS